MCQQAARPGRNRGLCEQHYRIEPTRGYVDPAEARERIVLLRSRGVTLRMLTEHGVSRVGVRNIETKPRIRKLTAAKVMAIPVPGLIRTGAPVDATGTSRRLRALVAMGWPQTLIGEQLGTTQTGVSAFIQREHVCSETAVAVRELFDRWAMLPGPSDVSRRRARAWGWPVPLAWNEEDIDDPAATPHLGGGTTKAVDRIRDLQGIGVTGVNEIADTLGIQPDSVRRALLRDESREAVA